MSDAYGVVQDMSREGNFWDNAVAGSFFATLKNQGANHVWDTKAEAYVAIANYIHGFYSPRRLHAMLGYQSPHDYARQLKRVA